MIMARHRLAASSGLLVAMIAGSSRADGDSAPDIGWLNGRLENPRNWHFAEVVTFAAPGGLGDFFTIDVPYFRMGQGSQATLAQELRRFPSAVDSSLSIGAGLGVIPSFASSASVTVALPLTLAGRFDLVRVFDRTIELDARFGVVLLVEGARTRSWEAKLDAGASLRLPLDLSSGFGLLVGIDVYFVNAMITLPEVGFTF
jgi:hypothetical protein